MKVSLLLLAACAVGISTASAQTAPARPAPPATMAAPNTARENMSAAAEGTGPVSTDYQKSKKQRVPGMKAKKMKGSTSKGMDKMQPAGY